MTGKLFIYISMLSALIPIMIGIRYFKIQTRIGVLILVLSSISFFCDSLSFIWAVIFHNNYWVIHLYHIAELVVLGLFFNHFLANKVYFYILIAFAAYYLLDIMTFSGLQQINPQLIGIECLILIFYCVMGYYFIFTREEHFFLEKTPAFWFNTGVIIYFSGSFFSWLLFSSIHKEDGGGIGLWVFHNVANILKNSCFALGLWQVRSNA